MPPISRDDREHIVRHTAALWRDISGARFFVTGGTGFYGKWLLESIAAANDLLGARIGATVLSRDPARFAREVPQLAARGEFSWLVGDTADFAFPTESFDYACHFATASAAEVGAGGTATIMHTLCGTERVLQFARTNGIKRLLFASSGAVYGPQPVELDHIPEDYRGGPDPTDPASAYGEMKRVSELMCVAANVDCIVARGFSFVGPYLPLTDKFAVGSLIRDALADGQIRIHGDGSPLRSYLYAADLAIWLITLLVKAQPLKPYNVGSDDAIRLSSLANRIAETIGGVGVHIAHGPAAEPRQRYVPSVSRAHNELGLEIRVPLAAALSRTIQWAMQS